MTSNKSNGIEVIRKILLDAIKESQNEKIDVSYLGAPKYRLSIIAQDFKTAEKTLKPILAKIEKNASKANTTFKFSREESKKTGGD
jgi:translation initiation factor 2 subunit 1